MGLIFDKRVLNERFDREFRRAADRTGVPWEVIKACAIAESDLKPDARRREEHLDDESRGLMQVLLATARDMGFSGDPDALYDPAASALYGGKYLAWCHGRYPEIPDPEQRWYFSVAAYNAGRGNVNKALASARLELGIEHLAGAPNGPWQRWGFASLYLLLATGENARITIHHVHRVRTYWWQIRQLEAEGLQ